MAKRQTIWLSTMMVLSLMLIGFYTVNNNTSQVGAPDAAKTANTTAKKADTSKKDTKVAESSDYFIAKHLQENQDISKQQEQLEAVIADSTAPADKVEKAKNDLKALNDASDQQDNVVEQLMAEGFPDALVDQKDGKIQVTVQAQSLETKRAIKVMSIVSKEMKISAAKITVLTHE
ncbi:MAG: SpoIIIAH-like family protein [Tumebacillaceae bacterium]